MSSVKRTAIAPLHEELGGKMVEFAGWSMPIQYIGLKQEHLNVRKNVGLFDVSHMGEIRVKGPKALETVEWLTTNHVAKLQPGQAQYSLLPNHDGGVVDDLIVYCLSQGDDYLLCVNAANQEKDFQWITENNKGADITDESHQWGQIAIQGPKAIELTARLFGEDVKSIAPFHFKPVTGTYGDCLIAATGYTGENGFEVFVPWEHSAALWRDLLGKGQDLEVQPIGLGARDTLRTEMKYSLYGHEIDDQSNPYEAGLGWVTKPNLKDFVGKDKILAAKARGLTKKLIGFKMLDRGIPRQGYRLFTSEDVEIGAVTSGTLSPSTELGIGIAYVEPSYSEIGTEFHVDIRGRRLRAQVVKTPFVSIS